MKGKGKVNFTLGDERSGTIEDVYFILEMRSNILSVGQLLEKGFRVYSKGTKLSLEDKHGKIVASVEMAPNRMFKMNLGSLQTSCLKIDTNNLNKLWHMRFGHLGYRVYRLQCRRNRWSDCLNSHSRSSSAKDV